MEKRLCVSNKLVELACCLDPAICDVTLSKKKCQVILTESYRELESSRYGATTLPQQLPLPGTDVNFLPDQSALDVQCTSQRQPIDFKKLRLSLIKETAHSSGEMLTSFNEIQDEINHYLSVPAEVPALELWEQMSSKLPILSSMAKVL